ncbi:MAG: ribosome-binding factor, partial [Frankiaceae bacterium]|nr:ribosome-binding factor [Frankiaceae bacterium]
TVYGDDTARQDSGMALESAKGVLRSEVGRQIGIRHTPSLAFVSDAVPETARHLDDLLAAARAADERVAYLAEHAVPAGDADPYRHPREDSEGEDE